MVFVTSKAKTDPEPIQVRHQGYHVVLGKTHYFDVIPDSVHQPDSFPADRHVQVRDLMLLSSTNGYYINAYGKRRLLDGGLSTQYFAGCRIRWSQIPTVIRQMINQQAGPDARKWWRA